MVREDGTGLSNTAGDRGQGKGRWSNKVLPFPADLRNVDAP